MKKKIVVISGGFDPLHFGHLKLIKAASKLGKLLVVVNNDAFLRRKKGFVFMPIKDRLQLISAIKYVDKAIRCIDKDNTVCKTLAKINPDIFCNGGDRFLDDIPEKKICEKLGIEMKFNMGGKKIRSSSELVNKRRKE